METEWASIPLLPCLAARVREPACAGGWASSSTPFSPTVPLGTLAANWLGGYLVGVAVAYFSLNASLPPELRLLVVTGFMGGLTTFSTFSAEVVTLLSRGQFGWALATAGVHLFGSLALTALGILTVRWLLLRS
jgi:CrcB protein